MKRTIINNYIEKTTNKKRKMKKGRCKPGIKSE